MNTDNPAMKIAILIAFAVLFGTTLIALSVGDREDQPRAARWESEGGEWDRDTRVVSEAFAVARGGSLRLETDIGDVKIVGADADSVTVRVEFRGKRSDADDFDVRISRVEDGVEVLGRQRDRNGWHFRWDDMDVRYVVGVPAQYNLKLITSGGDFHVTGITGTVTGETSGGDITLQAITGDVRLETSGGDITLRTIRGAMIVETSGGDIIGTGLEGDVRAETSGGDVDLKDVRGKALASTSGGDIRLEVLENMGIDASTSGGNIVLRLPEAAKANVRAETASGSVRCDFPVLGSMEDGSLDGTINGGGPRVRAETSGGDISIRKVN